ncbi:MAG: anaerobic carbon-monoxide dehydrogenase catalytic subunit [Proteobacteria bacterium]|nr:anaerobic carbon-monoxide dehydrogenase catalytic subunit [Desulfobacteraceae bacterium]MBU3980424.1 anaerobic carbon-monoxide dehydrogenase catalytic subunit [Pseudomonadota bacterium]MBU4013229.1 anaerobic carbon-monoxide dehydrogenase catalytic subunit [Pseudomonadota bacterium]MBU4067864.1 anaerobic carbon-monoxide dehydrogenase catalytic subunit [Pseudomonadota bacterium]MBU4101489.1 anaerobic carbon-monoxide dehydrogenase catalytic subunit [Pseudomonadota bacterium]
MGIDCEGSTCVAEQAEKQGVVTYIQRMNRRAIEPCLFGQGGTCCRNCSFGPCMMIEGVPESIGLCGATPATVAARNFSRMVAAGSSAHMDHALETAKAFLAVAKGESEYKIKDEKKLRALAEVFEIKTEGRSTKDIAIELGEKALAEFGKQDGSLYCIKRAPEKRQELWKKLGVIPRGIQREVVELMHRTHMGTDQDYHNLIFQATRCALADGWGASMISTELQDIMFGTPVPIRAVVNLGVLSEDEVNIIVHGHEPILSEAMAIVSQDPELIEAAKKVGAKGINLAGVCCTGNEVLMRHGIPIAGSFIQQEIVLATGAVEAMVVDVQCVMQSLPVVAGCFHTAVITTSDRARIPGAEHIEVHHHNALEAARKIIQRAIDKYPQRGKVNIPQNKMDVVAGFSHETINHMLGGAFRASYRPLNDNIINGRIRGVGAVVGCDSMRVRSGYVHTTVVKELIANDVLVLVTGCAATACGRAGLLRPEAAELAGPGLREVCETVGMPPVLHMGSCVDNSRILIAATEIVREGGLGDDIYQIPAAGCAPEWMSEKAIAIGQYFVASGVFVVFGRTFPTTGSKVLTDYLFKEMENLYGGMWAVESDPVKMAQLMIQRIEKGREALGIQEKKERVLYDMEMRRELE